MFERSKELYSVPHVDKSGKYRVKVRERKNNIEAFKNRLRLLAPDGSFSDIGRQIGISGSSVNSYFRHNQLPKQSNLEIIAEKLNITLDDLLEGCSNEYHEYWTDMWLFKDENHLKMKIQILEVGDLIEEMKPINPKALTNNNAVDILIAITERAMQDLELIEDSKNPYRVTAEWWLDPVFRRQGKKK